MGGICVFLPRTWSLTRVGEPVVRCIVEVSVTPVLGLLDSLVGLLHLLFCCGTGLVAQKIS